MQVFLLPKNICKKGIRIEYIVFICYDRRKWKEHSHMRRKSAGKKLMAVLIAASLALTPVEADSGGQKWKQRVQEATFWQKKWRYCILRSGRYCRDGNRDHRWISCYRGTGNHRYRQARYREQRTGECGNRRNGVW